jgi:hypothetical protein
MGFGILAKMVRQPIVNLATVGRFLAQWAVS